MLELRPLPQSHDLFVLWEIAERFVQRSIAQPRFKLVQKLDESCSGESFIKPKENDDVGDLADLIPLLHSFLDFSYILLPLCSPTKGHLFPGNFKHRHLNA
jgi:hypothetical protein